MRQRLAGLFGEIVEWRGTERNPAIAEHLVEGELELGQIPARAAQDRAQRQARANMGTPATFVASTTSSAPAWKTGFSLLPLLLAEVIGRVGSRRRMIPANSRAIGAAVLSPLVHCSMTSLPMLQMKTLG